MWGDFTLVINEHITPEAMDRGDFSGFLNLVQTST